jgi:hypothetical protein
MHSENGVLIDFEEVRKLIERADVFTISFANLTDRLLVDTRANTSERPLIQVVEPTGSARQRLAWIQRRRPSLGPPESLSFILWPHSPAFLVESGVWERLRRRVRAEAEPDVAVQCDLALKQLQNLDAQMALAVLRGENCISLWPPSAQDEKQDSDG